MKIISFRGFSFDYDGVTNHYWCAVEDADAYGKWSMVPTIAARRNVAGEITGFTVSERPIATKIGYKGPLSLEAAFHYLVGQLNPLNVKEPGRLVIELNDEDENGDPILLECDAYVTTAGTRADGEIQVVQANFIAVDPLWHSVDTTMLGPTTVTTSTYGGLTFDVEGQAPVNATVRLTPVLDDSRVYVWTFTITNNNAQPLTNYPYCVNFTDTSGGGVATYYTLLLDGKPQRADFQGFGTTQSYLWLVIPFCAPGESLTYTILTSVDYALESPAFNSYTQPAFRYEDTPMTATGGSTTTFVKTGAGWTTNQFKGGVLYMNTGPNADESMPIVSNTTDTITLFSIFPSAVAAGNTGTVFMSSNEGWNYDVRRIERNNNQRGLWWINQGQKAPSDARFDVPGGWSPTLYYDNDDNMAQKSWTPVTIGSDADYFAGLDANRTWHDAAPLKELGNADGVTIALPNEIVSLAFDYKIKNPNGVGTFLVGSRESGAGQFIEELTNSTGYDTLTDIGVATVTFEPDTHQVYLGLVPTTVSGEIQDEIDPLWAGDNGTATSGTTTQLNDNTKTFISNQYVGGTLKVLDGTNKGQSRTITANGTNTVTTSAFPKAHDSTTRYSIKQKPLIATVQHNSYFVLGIDSTGIDCSTPSGPTPGYVLDRELMIDRASASSDPPYQRIRFSEDYTGRHIVFVAGETLVIDGETMSAYIDASARPTFIGTTNESALASGGNSKATPVGTASGDTIVSYVRNYNGAVLTPPTGHFLAETITVSGVTHSIYYGTAVGSGTVTWTYGSTPSVATVTMATYRGCGAFVNANQATTASGTSHAVANPSTDTTYGVLLTLAEQANTGFENASLGTWVSPASTGFTKTFAVGTAAGEFRSGTKGGKLTVTANTNGVNGQVNIDNDDMIPVAPSTSVTVSAWHSVTSTAIHPKLQVHWHTSAGAYISSSIESDYTPGSINTFYQRTFTATAPANAAQMKASVAVVFTTAALTGTYRMDDVAFSVTTGGDNITASSGMRNRTVTSGARLFDGTMNGDTANVTLTTPATTHQQLFLLSFTIPETELVTRPIPTRSLLVQDVEADGTERLAEQWLMLEPGPHTLRLTSLVGGNDYVMEAEYREAWFA